PFRSHRRLPDGVSVRGVPGRRARGARLRSPVSLVGRRHDRGPRDRLRVRRALARTLHAVGTRIVGRARGGLLSVRPRGFGEAARRGGGDAAAVGRYWLGRAVAFPKINRKTNGGTSSRRMNCSPATVHARTIARGSGR